VWSAPAADLALTHGARSCVSCRLLAVSLRDQQLKLADSLSSGAVVLSFSESLLKAGKISREFSVVRAPLLTSLIGAVGLSVLDQAREIFRVLALDFREQRFQILSAFFFLLLASVALWRMAYDLSVFAGHRIEYRTRVRGFSWLPGLCGVIAPLGMACALFWSSQELGRQELPKEMVVGFFDGGALPVDAEVIAAPERLMIGAGVAFAIGLLVAVLAALFRPNFARSQSSGISDWDILGHKMRYVVLGMLIFLIAFYAAFPVVVPQALGSVSIFLQFVLLLGFCASLITLFGDRYRMPAITILFVWAVLLSTFNLNDNHIIRPFESQGDTRRSVKDAFDNWYRSRADRLEYERRNEPYPVVLVAAAGGGIYAAQYAATVLARLQDRCPNFAQHVFTISGVSGGSLGAAVFASLAKLNAPNAPSHACVLGRMNTPGEMERRASQILKRDFLSPVVATGLFPDFLQRFLPFPIQRFDRARAFEAAVNDAWDQTMPGEENPFKKGFLEHWPAPKEGVQSERAWPALILNTTAVEGGFRVPIQPFENGGLYGPLSGDVDFQSYIKEPIGNLFDVTLGTAVSLSARFPWIMPAGSVELQTIKRIMYRVTNPDRTDLWDEWFGTRIYRRLVDGGYFENSGVESLLDIINNQREELDPLYAARERAMVNATKDETPVTKRFSLYTIVINSFQEKVDVYAENHRQGISELLSPIRTMLNTRERRGYEAVYRGLQEQMLLEGRFPSFFVLNQTDFRFPLGWQISDVTRRLIARHSGEPQSALVRDWGVLEILGGVVDSRDKVQRIGSFLNLSDNSACEIVAALHNGPRDALKCNLSWSEIIKRSNASTNN